MAACTPSLRKYLADNKYNEQQTTLNNAITVMEICSTLLKPGVPRNILKEYLTEAFYGEQKQHVQATVVGQSDLEAQESLYWGLRKWLVGMVATWINDKECNQLILTFIGPQGIYKTTFFRHVLPPLLQDYFWENTQNSFSHKDDRIACSENCLVDIEEIEAIEGSEMEQLKGLVTAQYIKERRPYSIMNTGRDSSITCRRPRRQCSTYPISHSALSRLRKSSSCAGCAGPNAMSHANA